ncbi:MAG: SNF2-related protein, partial [Roseomonas mucosa]|nr:SNF2-related protein [Roseomonas mucosa]
DTAAERQQKLQLLAQNDYDFVFISQPAWNDIDVDPITKGQYVNSDFWTQRGDALGNAGSKRLNEIRTRYQQAIAGREFGKREDTLYFGDLGIDMLLMDEGHAFKNLFSAKNRFGESPKFLGGSGESNRALDTYYKSRQLRERSRDGGGVYMLTATPTKNSPLEVYSMLSHIAPEAFERMGIKNSEEFLDRFCEFETDTIVNLDGSVQESLVVSGFKNLDELREVMRRYIDRKTAEDVGLVLPEADARTHAVDMSPEQLAVYADLRERAKQAALKKDSTGEDHIFSIMDKMQKAATDLSMLGEEHAGAASPKLDAVVRQARAGAEEGGQVIFAENLSTHDRLLDMLVRAGVPREHIGVINAQATPSGAARQKVADAFNAGKIKYVIGNTATMGEGINLQRQTSDIHHVDLPWEPASMQQRNGRGRRQGNKRGSIRIHTYLAKRSFDAYRYQTIAAKKDWQDLLWNGGDKVENLAKQSLSSRHGDMLIMLADDPEEAAKAFAANKQAAEERRIAAEQGKALDAYKRLSDMEASIASLRQKGVKGDALSRLEQKAAWQRDRLADNKHFLHKELLAS